MGYMRHNAIVVTYYKQDQIEMLHAYARELFTEQVSNIVTSPANGYYSFFIAPDGSKEGWDTSAKGDQAREAFMKFARAKYSHGVYADVVELSYGGDEAELAHIVGTNVVEEYLGDEEV